MSNAAIYHRFDYIDALSTPATVEVRASDLKEGMVLVDPFLGTPLCGVDHKLPSPRNSGCVRLFCADLEDGGWCDRVILSSVMVKVIAA